MWSAVADSKGVVVGALAALALAAVLGRARRVEPDCRLDQLWSQGDQHFWETLELASDGTGVWTEGGFDSDAPHGRLWFAWREHDGAITFRRGAREVALRYTIEPRETFCFLALAAHPFEPDRTGTYLLTDGPPY